MKYVHGVAIASESIDLYPVDSVDWCEGFTMVEDVREEVVGVEVFGELLRKAVAQLKLYIIGNRVLDVSRYNEIYSFLPDR